MTIDEQKSIINLPDLLFVRYCEETFGLNRGVYNTIDQWFYKKDIEDIKVRRKKTLEFLLFCKGAVKREENRLKFGNGNLTNLLMEYAV